MNIVKPFAYRALDRITRPDGVRHYVCPDTGALLPSVTTLIAATDDKRQLLEWRARVGDKVADQTRDDALALGTLMHTHLEAHVLGQPRPGGSNTIRKLAAQMADAVIAQGLRHVDEVWGCEVALYAARLYAGTTDLIGLYKGVPAIMDYKTARVMKTRAQIQNYMCQLAAYALSHDELYGTAITTGVVFMVDRTGLFRSFVLEGREFARAASEWEQRVVRYYAEAA